jgi:hypothetical protein
MDGSRRGLGLEGEGAELGLIALWDWEHWAGWCKAGVEDLVYLFIGYGAAAFPWWWAGGREFLGYAIIIPLGRGMRWSMLFGFLHGGSAVIKCFCGAASGVVVSLSRVTALMLTHACGILCVDVKSSVVVEINVSPCTRL